MAGDRTRWAYAKAAVAVLRPPAGQTVGRWDGLRLIWATQVNLALEEAVTLRAYAAALAGSNPKTAFDLLRKAEQTASGIEVTVMSEEDNKSAIAAWEAEHGSWDDPATRDKVYKAIAEMRRRKLEEEGKLSVLRAAAQRKVAATRHQPGKPRAAPKR